MKGKKYKHISESYNHMLRQFHIEKNKERDKH